MPDTLPLDCNSVTVVLLTHNRRNEVLRTLGQLTSLPEMPPIIVVDNGSSDGTAYAIGCQFPQARLVRLPANIGAAARNHGVSMVRTKYVAFCDDDTWWAPGSIALAARLLDQTPKIAVLCARVMVGRRGRLDPTSAVMQRSPLASDGLPGRAILGFMAGASIMRVDAFREVGGYCAQLFIGGEEQLVALDLAARGWKIVYCPALTVRHFPSASRDTRLRHQLLARNAVWVAWMRLPWAAAWRVTWTRLAARELRGARLRTIVRALAGLPWALYRRRVLPPEVENERRLVGDGSDCGRRQGDSPACPICGGVGSGLPAGLRASPRSSVAYLHGGVACAYCGRRDEPVPGMAAAFIGRYGEDS